MRGVKAGALEDNAGEEGADAGDDAGDDDDDDDDDNDKFLEAGIDEDAGLPLALLPLPEFTFAVAGGIELVFTSFNFSSLLFNKVKRLSKFELGKGTLLNCISPTLLLPVTVADDRLLLVKLTLFV